MESLLEELPLIEEYLREHKDTLIEEGDDTRELDMILEKIQDVLDE